MKNWTFRQWNTVLGWVIFAIAFITYLSTIEPNFSFWDCGEYISSAVKLEVTHAPGAALFQIVGAVAGIFALGNGENYSLVINAMSALFSAFTILFLFWTITHFVRRLLNKDFDEVTRHQEIAILFAGVIGSLCFTFSDTFWFSAVEGEVYSMASMFIALLVWLITKWENEYLAADSDRWIVLIFFIVGLSVGVHMMCMLAIPAVCLVYYTRNYEFTWKNFLIANVVTLLILAIVFKFIFPLIMTMFGRLEIFMVNGLSLPFHSGTIVGFIVMVAISYFIIKYARKAKKKIYQTAALSAVFMIIGFSCWMVIPIRANANPPMNLNDPDTAIGMLDYYNREQYGDWPTIYGQNYTAFLDANGIEKNEDGSFKTNKTGDIYEKDEKTNSYRKTGERFNYVFNKDHVSLMPRMFNEDKAVMANYMSMYGAPKFEFNFDNPDIADSPEAQQIFSELQAKFDEKDISVSDYLKVRPYNLIKVQRPSFADNMHYFITFQNGYYFVRYLFWNFVGRQNDLEGSQEITRGNWISGIPVIDNYLYGDQNSMPAKFRNESTVTFFFLPLLLGFLGCYFQLNRDFGRFYALLSLFILTSIGIVFYTGMKPYEPRERDYATVGSFYAFAIWIGLGAAAILWYLQSKVKSNIANIGFGIVLLGVPLMMGFQNYNTHDRSKRYTAYDYSHSVLKSLPKNDILFVYGDNDTYPVWAMQETERFRDDVKVVNFTLLSTPWNIDQVKRRTYNAMPIPSELTHEDYRDGVNDQVYIMKPGDWKNVFDNLQAKGTAESVVRAFQNYLVKDSMTIKEAVDFIKIQSPEKDEVLKEIFGGDKYEKYNFLPVNKFVIPVNKANAVKSGTITAADLPNVVDHITVDYQANTLYKSNLMMFDILANFDWKRPINFSSGGVYESENIFFLDEYLQFDGFSYRLIPIHTPRSTDGELGRVDGNSLYNIVKNFKWGNFKNLNVHFDETATSNIISYRGSASRAAAALALKGDKKRATEILDLASKEIPASKYNDPRSLSSMAYGYIMAGQEKKGLEIAEVLKKGIFEEYDFYLKLKPEDQRNIGRQMKSKPAEYSLVVTAVTDAYRKLGQKQKAYDYLVKSIAPIDKKFNIFINSLQSMSKEKAKEEVEKNAQKVTSYYSYLIDVIEPIDSNYARKKEEEINKALFKMAR